MDGEARLTERQAVILRYIFEHLDRTGEPPVLREIAAACGHTRQAAHRHIRDMRLLGVIHPSAIHEPRNIHLTALAHHYLARVDKIPSTCTSG